MRVKMLTLMAGPDGVGHPGQVLDLPKDRAYALVEAGSAEQIEDAPETASVEAPDNAMRPRARRRRGSPETAG